MDFTNNINSIRNLIPTIVSFVTDVETHRNLMTTSKIFNVETELQKEKRKEEQEKFYYKEKNIKCCKCKSLAAKKFDASYYCRLHFEFKLIDVNCDLDDTHVLDGLVKISVNDDVIGRSIRNFVDISKGVNIYIKIVIVTRMYSYSSLIDKKFYYKNPDLLESMLESMTESLRKSDHEYLTEKLPPLIKYHRELKEEISKQQK